MYRFGHQQVRNIIDPSSQTEDLGDDAMKASAYGILNLKRILPRLEEWTSEGGKDYRELKTMYGQLMGQFNRYMGHVSSNIGGVYEYFKTSDQQGAVYVPVPKAHQKKALSFLNKELFETPQWLIDENIISKTQYSGSMERLRNLQVRTLERILKPGRLTRLIEDESLHGSEAYTILEMMNDLRSGIWKELTTKKSIDPYRRNLQRAYVEQLDFLLNEAKNQRAPRNDGGYLKQTAVTINQSDIKPVVRGELRSLKSMLKRTLPYAKNTITKYHLQDIIDRIEKALNPIK